MNNAIYVALSRQTGVGRQLSVVANNLANSNTVGFHGDQLLFKSHLTPDAGGRTTAFVEDVATIRNTSQGRLEYTGNPLDLAVNGPGYFAVSGPNGNAYTRAGNFVLDSEGSLSTIDGYKVQDDGGSQIDFQEDDREIVIFGDGRIEVDGEERGQIGFYQFADEQKLKRLGGNLYGALIAPIPNEGEGRIAQGMIEKSNIAPVTEITNLIQLQRAYTSTAKFISDMYELQETAIRKLAQQV
jgi:flagellar basal-body rod protein FlgF